MKLALCPAATEIGSVYPLTEYPVPEADSAVIVSVALPVLEIFMDWAEDPPTATFPKGTGFGVTDICACVGAVPVPLSGTVNVDGEALLLIVMLPFTLPAEAGAN